MNRDAAQSALRTWKKLVGSETLALQVLDFSRTEVLNERLSGNILLPKVIRTLFRHVNPLISWPFPYSLGWTQYYLFLVYVSDTQQVGLTGGVLPYLSYVWNDLFLCVLTNAYKTRFPKKCERKCFMIRLALKKRGNNFHILSVF